MEARKLFRLILLCNLPWVAGCTSLLYHPSRAIYVDLKKLDPPPMDKEIQLKDGLVTHGWQFQARQQPSQGVVLFFHGNGQNRSAQFLLLYDLVKNGYDLAVYDYPGYGQTRGEPTPKSTVEMASEVIRKVHNQNPDKPLIVYGKSLGGAIAIRAVWELRNDYSPDLLVVDSSFTSYRSAARAVLSNNFWTWLLQPIGWLFMSDAYAPGDRLGDLKGLPVLVIHSQQDEMIPLRLGKQVYATAKEPKQIWIRSHSRHNDPFWGPEGKALFKKLVATMPKTGESKEGYSKRFGKKEL